jgi:hypothetical protein
MRLTVSSSHPFEIDDDYSRQYLMRKILVSLLWIVFLNGALASLFAELSVRFNPTISHEEAYGFGQTYGAYFFVISTALIIYLAISNRLPGAKR